MCTRLMPLFVTAILFGCDSTPAAEPATRVDASVVADADLKADARADARAVTTLDVAADADAAAGLTVAAELRPVADVEAVLGKPVVVAAADLSLVAVADLVISGAVTTAAELELALNAEGSAAHRIDLDADATLDYLQVVEIRTGADVSLELRAIPSSKLDAALAVRVATIDLVRLGADLEVRARFDAVVQGGAEVRFDRKIEAAFSGDAVVAANAGAFATWAFTPGRAVWISHHKARADVEVLASGDIRFVGDTHFALTAARFADLKARFAVKVAAPTVAVDTRTDAEVAAAAVALRNVGVKVKHQASARASAGGGATVGLGAGINVGASAGASVGGGAKAGGKAKSSGGLKIGF